MIYRNICSTFFLLLAALTFAPIHTVQAQETTTFILVRHAEKADDGTNDPPLNEVGKQRVAALADHLRETDITAIYSTSYKRTMQTVQPIADSTNLEIKTYDPFSESLIEDILKSEAGGTVLISGHSNTTPMLVNRLIREEQYEQLDETDYDNIFIVIYTKNGAVSALKLIY